MRISSLDSALAFERTTQCVRLNAARSIMVPLDTLQPYHGAVGHTLDAAEGLLEFPLGSGTSGGVLAPLLMMGAALGGMESMFLPDFGPGFWPLVSMGAILGGTMRSPFTGIVFAIELTHDFNMLLPLLVACFLAHLFTVLTLKRSILTEKISRRGYHLSREYATDPLEILFVREVMRTNVVVLPHDGTLLKRTKSSFRQTIPRASTYSPYLAQTRRWSAWSLAINLTGCIVNDRRRRRQYNFSKSRPKIPK